MKKSSGSRNPPCETDQRFYIAWDAVLLENEGSDFLGKTRFRGSFEAGEIDRNAPDVIPPTDGFSSWFEWTGIPGRRQPYSFRARHGSGGCIQPGAHRCSGHFSG